MKAVNSVLNSVSAFTIYGLVLLLPVIFVPLTTEYYDTAKFFLVSLATLILFLVWGVRLVTEGKLVLSKTPLDVFVLLFLVTAIISTVLSPSKYTSLFGIVPNFHTGLIYIISVTLLYFLLTSSIKSLKQVAFVSNLMVASAVIIAGMSLLTYFKVQFPVSLIGSFSPGSIYIAMVLPLTLKMLFSQPMAGTLINLLLVTTLVLTGNLPSWIAAGFASILTIYMHRSALRKILPSIFVLTFVALVLGLLTYYPKFSGSNFFGNTSKSLPQDLQLPFAISWKVSASAFRDSPILGTGPGTYIYNFTQYKPLEYNKTNLWNVRLSNAHDYYLQIWSEMGGIGIVMLLGLSLSFIFLNLKNANKSGLTIAGFTFILLMALTPLTALSQTAGFIILALAMISMQKHEDYEIGLGGISSHTSHPLIALLSFLPILLAFLAGLFFITQIARSEFYHHLAFTATSQNQLGNVYNNLVKAEQINPYIDVYRVDLAQTNFAIANALAKQKGPSESSPAGSLTDEDKSTIKQLLSQSIAESRTAVAIAPRSAANWEVSALIYRQISGVAQNALQFALDSYGHAITLDPLNPLLRLSVGGVYYQLKNYDLAIRFFDDAVSLKPDYVNGLYNLALTLRDKGAYNDGIVIAEKLVSQLSNKTDSKDYQLAAQLLSELRDKAPTKAAPNDGTPTSLEQSDLPKVLDLTPPQQIATPPAVKK